KGGYEDRHSGQRQRQIGSVPRSGHQGQPGRRSFGEWLASGRACGDRRRHTGNWNSAHTIPESK
ncbi:unnamed protein product, partial [Polarella glacialis]